MLADDASKAKLSLFLGAQLTPEEAAQRQRLARRMNTSPDVIGVDPKSFAAQAAIADAAPVLDSSPRLAAWLGRNPNAAAVAQDNVEELGALEGLFSSLSDGAKRVAKDPVGTTRAALLSGVASFDRLLLGTSEADKTVNSMAKVAINTPKDAARSTLAGGLDLGAGALGFGQAWIARSPDVGWAARALGFGETLGDAARGLKAEADALAPTSENATYRAGLNAFRSLPVSLAASAISLFGGMAGMGAKAAGALGAGAGGALTFGSSYLDAKDEGLGEGKAQLYALIQGALETGTELIPEQMLVGDILGKVPLGKMLGWQLVSENVGEQLATLTQDFTTWAMIDANKGKTFGDFLDERPGAAYETLVATTLMTGLQTGIMRAVSAGVEKLAPQKFEAQRNINLAELFDNTIKVTQALKTLQRDPETVREAIDAMADGTDVDQVFIAPGALESLAQSGLPLETLLPSAAGQDALEAMQTGRDIAVPIGELMTAAAQAPALWQALKDNVKVDPSGMTRAEAQEFMASDEAKMIADEINKATDAREAEQVVEDDRAAVEARLIENIGRMGRYSAPVVRAYAAHIGNFYAVLGQRLGKTATEVEAAYPLNFKAQAPTGDGYMGQSAAVGFEVAPDPNNIALADAWRALPPERQIEVSAAVASPVATRVGELLATPVAVRPVLGGYLGDINPAFQATVDDPAKAAEAGKAIGYILSQDSVVVDSSERFDGSEPKGAISIDVADEAQARQIGALLFSVNDANPDAVIGFTYDAEAGEIVVLNTGSLSTKALADAIAAVLPDGAELRVGERHVAFIEKEEYGYAGEDREGQSEVERGVREARAAAGRDIARALGFEQSARDGSRRDRGGSLAPLPGAPVVEGATGPDPGLVAVAEAYAEKAGLTHGRQAFYAPIDQAFAERLAAAYEAMPHAPTDPQVAEAYAELIRQTRAQYEALIEAGYSFTFFDSATDPYQGNPWNAMRDLRQNKRMAVYGTYDGYGTEGITGAAIEDNPMLADTGLRWPDQNGVEQIVTANDLFRAVHDAFGHGLEGAGFRARGEENAWQAHARLFTGPALAALTSETRGQNSWLNFGPHGETNRTAQLEGTVFAEQKTGLLPEWAWAENVVPFEDEALFQSERPLSDLGFYSPIERAIETSKLTRAPAAQWKATLEKTPGVKKEEIEWIGFFDWLSAQESPVNREELLDFVQNNGVQVEEIVKESAGGKDDGPSDADYEYISNRAYEDFNNDYYGSVEEAQDDTEYDLNNDAVDAFIADMAPLTLLGGQRPYAYLASDIAAKGRDALEVSPHVMWDFLVKQGVEQSPLEDTLDNGVGARQQMQRRVATAGLSMAFQDHLDRLVEDFQIEGGPRTIYRIEASSALRGGGYVEQTDYDNQAEAEDALQDAIDHARDDTVSQYEEPYYDEVMARKNDAGDTQWSEYKMPGGEDYTELLLTLPAGEGSNPDRSPDTHWDEPGVIAHVRFDTRRDEAGRKVLMIHEIQSDWHQAGKKEGYAVKLTDAQRAEIQAEIDQRYARVGELENTPERELWRQSVQQLAEQRDAEIAALARYQAVLQGAVSEAAKAEALGVHPQVASAVLDGVVSNLYRNPVRYSGEQGRRRLTDDARREIALYASRDERPFGLFSEEALAPYYAQAEKLIEQAYALVIPYMQKRAMVEALELNPPGATEIRLLETEAAQLKARLNGSDGVPDAPFKNEGYAKLAIRRMMRYAVDNGFPAIAWIRPEQYNGGQTGGDDRGAWFYDRNLVNIVNDIIKPAKGKTDGMAVSADLGPRPSAEITEEEQRAAQTPFYLDLFGFLSGEIERADVMANDETVDEGRRRRAKELRDAAKEVLAAVEKYKDADEAGSGAQRVAAQEMRKIADAESEKDWNSPLANAWRVAATRAEGIANANADMNRLRNQKAQQLAAWERANANALSMQRSMDNAGRVYRMKFTDQMAYEGRASQEIIEENGFSTLGELKQAAEYAEENKRFNMYDLKNAYAAASKAAAAEQGNLGFDITPALKANIEAGLPLFQQQRGAFIPSQNLIVAFERADLSTMLHETAHFFLEVYMDVAAQPDAPQQIVNDMQAFLDWTGIKDLATWRTMSLGERRDAHEKFARGVEKKLMSGRAPSLRLEALFRTFRSWLISVYRSMKNLDVKVPREVSQVMDRMLATDQEIADMEAARSMAPLFAEAQASGMSEVEWKAYQALAGKATEEAQDELAARGLRDMQWLANSRSREIKRLQQRAKAIRNETRKAVAEEVMGRPVFRAMTFLKRGTIDGQPVEGGFKLAISEVDAILAGAPGAAAAKAKLGFGKYGMLGNENGIHPQQVAELFGFPDGETLINALINAPDPQVEIDGITEQRLLEEHGDLTDQTAIERAADKAIHSEARGRFIATELAALNKAVGKRKVLAQAAKSFAERTIARLRVRDLKPAVYAAAEARAAKASMKAFATGNLATAAAEKRNQLVNFMTARAAIKAAGEIEAALTYLAKFNREGTRKAIDPEYRDQIDQLLERFDLRKGQSLKAIDKRKSLMAWVEKMREQGIDPLVPEELLVEAGRRSFRDMTVEEMRGLVDTIKNIEHLGRLKTKLLTAKRERDFQRAVDKAEAAIRDNATRQVKDAIENNRWIDKAASGVKSFFAMHRKLASLVRQMDGFKDGGIFWEILVRPMNAAGDKEAAMRADATRALARVLKPITDAGGLRKKLFIPEIGKAISLEGRLAIALNMGNETNRLRVMEGDRWTGGQVEAILRTLTAEQWQTVQAVWDYIDSYWPQVREKELRVSGVAPEKVEAEAFTITTADGQTLNLKGGYYPIKYDPLRSSKAEADNLAETVKQSMQGLYTRATTRRGHTKARVESVKRPIRKDLGVLFQHVTEVIHDLSWHEWLIDANRLLAAGQIDGAIRDHYGPEVLRVMKDAVRDIAVGDIPAQNIFESVINHIRSGTSIAGMGWNLLTSLQQPLGLANTIRTIGPKWTAIGVGKVFGDTVRLNNAAKWVADRSVFMASRVDTQQREISEIRNKVARDRGGRAISAVQDSYFWLISRAQLLVDLPTWVGAYEKHMAAGETEDRAVALADQAVIDSQGGGQIKDLAAVQRGGPLMKLWTNFYSFMNLTYNQLAEEVGELRLKGRKQLPYFLAEVALVTFLPTTLGLLLRDAFKGGDDDDDETLAEKLAKENAGFLLGTMVGTREIGSMISSDIRYTSPAGLRFLAQLDALITQVGQGEADEALWKAANATAGTVLHYPATQVDRTVRGFRALADGETSNPVVLLTGPRKEAAN